MPIPLPLVAPCSALFAAFLVAGPVTRSNDTHADELPAAPQFEAPTAIRAGGEPVRTESPGYAAPAWYDVTGDGRNDLVVGQFAGGKMAVYAGQEDGSLGARDWLQADGKVAEVPGVW